MSSTNAHKRCWERYRTQRHNPLARQRAKERHFGEKWLMRAKYMAWAICAAGLAVFALLAWQVKKDDNWLSQFDDGVAQDAKRHAAEHPHLLAFARIATYAGGTRVMPALAIVGSILLILKRQPKLAVFWLVTALLGEAINEGTKALIDRPRPGTTLRDESVHESSSSFPSGHAMGSIIGYGAMTYVGWVLLKSRGTKFALTTLLAATVLVIGWTRVYLRAHWCSDVLGGWVLGLSWLSLYIAVLDGKEKKQCPVTIGADGRM
jgi:undecaprenyl-diphosphatase